MSYDDFYDCFNIQKELVEVFEKYDATSTQMLYTLSTMLILCAQRIDIPKDTFIQTMATHFDGVQKEIENYEKEGKLKK